MTHPCMTRPLLLALAPLVLLAGCGMTPVSDELDTGSIQRATPAAALAESSDPAPLGEARPTPRLQPGDKAKIIVYGEERLSGDYEVDTNGTIQVPLIGSVTAAGLTKKELQQVIADRLRKGQILRHPVVTVDVSSFRPFYVLGEVEKPGEYAYRNGLSVMSAVAVAGGFTYRASKYKVKIQRAGEQGFTEHDLASNVPVYPGDLISVPERYF